MTNAINWFEIPVTDYERAKKFYGAILNGEIMDYHMPEKEMKYGIFPYDMENHGVGGAIIEMKDVNPSTDGTTVYLNGGDDLSIPLARVEAAGGSIMMPKTSIGENGFFALFMDTEGNKVAFHSMK